MGYGNGVAQQSGQFAISYTLGFAAPVAQTWNYIKVGRSAVIWPAAQVSDVSTSAFFSTAAGAVPAFLRPARSARFVADALDNGAAIGCIVLLNAANGALSLGASLANSLINNWTAAGVKAFPNSPTLGPMLAYSTA